MIIQEQIGETMIRTYSNKGVMIHGGFPEADYSEAIDPISAGRTYTETDIPIPSEEITDTQALNILLGRRMPDDSDGSDETP